MTAEEGAIAELAAVHGTRACGGCAAERRQQGQEPAQLDPRLDVIDQSVGRGLDAVTGECASGWRRTEPVRPGGVK